MAFQETFLEHKKNETVNFKHQQEYIWILLTFGSMDDNAARDLNELMRDYCSLFNLEILH